MKISIGPNLFFWNKQQTYDFYSKVSETVADIIYVGETVCAKRRELSTDNWIELAKDLKRLTDKEIVLSTLSIIESQSELGQLKKVCANHEILVEANDMAAVDTCIQLNVPFVTGPAINIYNHKTLGFLYKNGLKRWVAPVELSKDSLRQIISNFSQEHPNHSLETEVFSWGFMPLAFSARCYSSRVKKLSKDNCHFNCIEDTDGIPVSSQENQTIFNLNGIQTQSGKPVNLLPLHQEIKQTGVQVMRISPQSKGFFTAISDLKSSLNHEQIDFNTDGQVNGYWLGKAGFEAI